MSGEPNEVKWRGVRQIAGVRGIWPARNATRVNESVSRSGVGTEIVYTVPEAKILFISSAQLSSGAGADAIGVGRLGVRNSAQVLKYWILNNYHQIQGMVSDSAFLSPALECEMEDEVFVECLASSVYARGIIHGWLEDE